MRQQKSWKDKYQLVKRGGSSGGGGGGGGGATTASKTYYDPNPVGTHDQVEYLYVARKDEVIEAYQKLTGLTKSETTDSLKDIHDFMKNGFSSIRANEERGKPDSRVDNINRFIKSAPKFKGEIYRGLSFGTEKERQGFLDAIGSSATFSLKSMSSFSSTKSVGEEFANQRSVGVVISVKSNHSGVSIQKMAYLGGEGEVIVPKGSRYKITSREIKGDNVYIKAEEIP